jgi:hypothetical protein
VLNLDDKDALTGVLPDAKLFASEFGFYLSTASFFAKAMEVYHEVHFTQLAISVAPDDMDCTDLWYMVIKGYTDLTQYEDAYSAITATPYQKL